MSLTWKSAGVILGTLVAGAGVVTAGYNFTVWIDDMFIDSIEMQGMIDKQNDILNIMNDNIINVGAAIYDRKIDEIDRWIKELTARVDRNAAEDAFLITLEEQREQVLAKKEKLSRIQVSF